MEALAVVIVMTVVMLMTATLISTTRVHQAMVPTAEPMSYRTKGTPRVLPTRVSTNAVASVAGVGSERSGCVTPWLDFQ